MSIVTPYEDLLRFVLETGTPKSDRTGTGTRSLFGQQMRYDLSAGFPLLTTKKVHFKSVAYELLWFLRGDSNIGWLHEHGVTIWDEWASDTGELGPIYGVQWRSWPAPSGEHIDQISAALDLLRTDPDSRRIIVSAWNVGEIERMALPPCHAFFQFYVADGPHYSFAAFDGGAQPSRVGGRTIRSAKLVVSQPCVLFPKLNPRIPRIWNITSLPSEMALASTEFVVLRPVGVDTSALWAALRQPDVLAELRQLVGGMTGSRQRIQPTQLLRVWVRDVRRLTPGHAAAIANLGALCNERRIESARLASCRDALLPLLMSGIDGLPAGR